jgi:hypothetical protein
VERNKGQGQFGCYDNIKINLKTIMTAGHGRELFCLRKGDIQQAGVHRIKKFSGEFLA